MLRLLHFVAISLEIGGQLLYLADMNTLDHSKPRNFRLLLQQELMNRCAKNPQYSLRSFAKFLGIQAPTLSHYLRGNRKITPVMMKRLAKTLGFGPEEIQNFIPDEESASTDLMQLTLDHFYLISEWYHFAILELMNLENFTPDPRTMARSLGITISEINMAVERLVRLGFIEINTDGEWILCNSSSTTIGHEFNSVAHKKLQKQFLQKAIEAIDSVPADKRDQTGMTLSLDLADMPEVKNRIKKFRRELTNFIERKKAPKDDVYQLSISFYPLTKINNETGEDYEQNN